MYQGKEKETISNGRLFLCPDNCLCRDYAPRYPFRSNCQVKAILHGTMDKIKAGIECRGMDIRKGRDVDVRNGREMVAGLNRKREDSTSP